MEKQYYIEINGFGMGYTNSLDKIKDGLYELFGDIPIATNDGVMFEKFPSIHGGLVIEIKPCED